MILQEKPTGAVSLSPLHPQPSLVLSKMMHGRSAQCCPRDGLEHFRENFSSRPPLSRSLSKTLFNIVMENREAWRKMNLFGWSNVYEMKPRSLWEEDTGRLTLMFAEYRQADALYPGLCGKSCRLGQSQWDLGWFLWMQRSNYTTGEISDHLQVFNTLGWPLHDTQTLIILNYLIQ